MAIVPVRSLTELAQAILEAAGARPEAAAQVAASLVGADQAGHGSHGVMKLPSYLRDIRAGRLDPAAEPSVREVSAALATVDGEGGFGHLAAAVAADLAVAKARETGLAAVSVAHAHHTGRLGGWSERIARSGFIGLLAGAEAQGPYKVVPHGGRTGALATNPVTWAVPRRPGLAPVLLDYATSIVSIGKLQIAHLNNQPAPPGLMLTADGAPTTEIQDFFDGGHLLPFGGHKGYALGVIAELLSVGLSTGDRFGPQVRSSCLFVLALDPAVLRPADDFYAFVDKVARRMTDTASAAGQEVLVPGDPEVRARAANAEQLTIPDATRDALLDAARQLGASVPADLAADRQPEAVR